MCVSFQELGDVLNSHQILVDDINKPCDSDTQSTMITSLDVVNTCIKNR